ncbi:TetR/AcrR family transcriptional regulator [Carnobacterium divergens]|uniref:TetR/AcrR family transcriptional regulator n=1 Tax=Carnobacterium divergens TaxID=2748 RepID=UPI0007F33A94|nr:TetR/AcrR family transcriptional regulator [Carnobacterium divergens]SBO17127.1 Transcriptional regulator, TetR family [Carnobacterium divergens]
MISKRNFIINSALKLFGERGFSKVTIKEISNMANVSQVTIYNHFKNKEDLAEECTNILFNEIEQVAEKILLEDIPYSDKLNKVLEVCNSKISQSIAKYFTPESLEDPKLIVVLENTINKRKNDIYLKYLEQGYSVGVIDDTIDLNSILALMNTINYIGKFNCDITDIEKLTKDLHHLFLYGIIGIKSTNEKRFSDDELFNVLIEEIRKKI